MNFRVPAYERSKISYDQYKRVSNYVFLLIIAMLLSTQLIGLRVCNSVIWCLVFDFTDASFVYSVIVKARTAFKNVYKCIIYKAVKVQEYYSS